MLALAVALAGCGWGYTPSDNVLPEPSAEETEDEGPPPPDVGDPGADVPATYRFDCVDIQSLGDADQEVFQVATLQSTWAQDIANFKLNILIDVLSEDADAGEATITIRSGVGSGWADQCGETNTESEVFPVQLDPTADKWTASGAPDSCAEQDPDAAISANYRLEMGAEDFVYIYAEDDDGTAFNCSLEAAAPNAIPISAVSSSISMAEDRSTVAGTLTGCMSEAGALNICSCLAVCEGDEHPDCPGCPGGAVPLGLLLGGVGPTQNCSDILGEPAFDVVLQFTASRLGEVPMACG